MNNLYDVATGGDVSRSKIISIGSAQVFAGCAKTALSYRPSGLNQSLLLVAFLLDDVALGRVLEIVAGRNEGTPRDEGGHLRP